LNEHHGAIFGYNNKMSASFEDGLSIDNKYEDGRFPVSGSWVTISNPDSLPNSKTGINHEIRS
jgi:hypothetical protein